MVIVWRGPAPPRALTLTLSRRARPLQNLWESTRVLPTMRRLTEVSTCR